MDPTRRWYHHPLVTFLVPLVVLLVSPHLYTFLGSHTLARPYNEAKIREIATLVDDLYTMLADMTFIPHTAIKRGPHTIDTASIPCKRDPAVLLLMELLPYIDTLELQDVDWNSDLNPLDYRRKDHLHEGCDPLHSEDSRKYMAPQTIGLMSWGDVGRRYGVLVYDTYRRALRTQQSSPSDATDTDAQWPDAAGVEIFGQAMHHNLPTWSLMQYLWATWFDAPTLLKMMKETLRSSQISPWEVFGLGDEWIFTPRTITEILHRNGWPNSFDPDNFNADVIRAKHAAWQTQDRHLALTRRYDLWDDLYTYDADYYPEEDNPVNIRLGMIEQELAEATDEQQQWVIRWRLQKETWDLANDKAELKEVEQVVKQVCPDDDCQSGKDIILWEYRAVEKAYLKAQDMPSAESECEKQLARLPEWAPPDPDRFSNCVSQRKLRQHWLSLAHSKSRAAALEFCGGDASCLLRSSTLENLAEAKIATLERDIAYDKDRVEKMAAWAPTLPPHATEAIEIFTGEETALVERVRSNGVRIKWIEEVLAGGDREKLWRCVEHHTCE